MNAINGSEADSSYFGSVIDDCRDLLAQLHLVCVEYNHRNSNILAHNLAKIVVMLPEYHVWGGPYDLLLASALYSAQHV